jgi:ubiquinone/menaquinone biosynthesis C-methylase UbiE
MNERTFSAADAHKLEDPERLKWLPPNEVITSLELQAGMPVADIGAGTGYFTLPIARTVGSGGKVHAVDFQTAMLDLLGKKLLEPNAPANITLVHGTATHTTLPDKCVEFVFLANVWHEVDDHALVLKEAARILKNKGRLAILDWRPNVQRPPGPPLEHRISATAVAEDLNLNGWTVERLGNVGNYSYLIMARRGY